jgi:hypothetical protein
MPQERAPRNSNLSVGSAALTASGNAPRTDAKCGFASHAIAADKGYVFTTYPKR